jgi:hypothetical protein
MKEKSNCHWVILGTINLAVCYLSLKKILFKSALMKEAFKSPYPSTKARIIASITVLNIIYKIPSALAVTFL